MEQEVAMSIKSFVGPDGRVGYRVRVNIGSRRADGSYPSKCRTVYGTAIQAQQLERQMKDSANRARNCRTPAEIIMTCRDLLIQDSEPVLLAGAYERALAKPHSRSTSETRIRFKRNYWLDFIAWMKKNAPLVNYMQNVTPVHAENYIASLRKHGSFIGFQETGNAVKLSNDTLNCYHKAIQQVFELMKNETGMTENPFSGIRQLPSDHAERNAYTGEQLRMIFDKADEYLYPLFFIGLLTGLSEGDVCTLRKDEIHFDRHHIYRKRNKTRNRTKKISSIPMLPVLEDFLRKQMANDGSSEFVLPEQAADYLRDRSFVSKKIKRFLEFDCEFDTTVSLDGRSRKHSVYDFHSLRHTFCSMAGVVGIPEPVVRDIVGHMTPRMTELYNRHIEEQERLRWIGLLGERISEIPSIGFAAALPYETEPERQRLIDRIRELPIEDVRRILSGIDLLLSPVP